jgi:hypothetical protein
MSYAPDGSQLAVNVSTKRSVLPSAIYVLATTGRTTSAAETAFGNANCGAWVYSNVQRTGTGLYAVGSCQDRSNAGFLSVVRLDPRAPQQGPDELARWNGSDGYVAQLAVRDAAGGPTFYIDQTDYDRGLIRVLTTGSSGPSRIIRDLRLSGPSTYAH